MMTPTPPNSGSDFEQYWARQRETTSRAAFVQRPFGISLLAVLAVIGGVISVAGGAVFWNQTFQLAARGRTFDPSALSIFLLYTLMIVVGIADFIFAYGAWKLKPWARKLGIGIYVITIVSNVLQMGYGIRIQDVGGIVLAAGVIYYLTCEHVKEVFASAAPR